MHNVGSQHRREEVLPVSQVKTWTGGSRPRRRREVLIRRILARPTSPRPHPRSPATAGVHRPSSSDSAQHHFRSHSDAAWNAAPAGSPGVCRSCGAVPADVPGPYVHLRVHRRVHLREHQTVSVLYSFGEVVRIRSSRHVPVKGFATNHALAGPKPKRLRDRSKRVKVLSCQYFD